MGDLSKNFNRSEFACKCGCGLDSVQDELVEVIQDVRDHFNEPVKVTSGCRCSNHNDAVGGSPRSKHLLCMAGDIKVAFTQPKAVHEYLTAKYPDKYGIGLYNSFVHIDTRQNKARWDMGTDM